MVRVGRTAISPAGLNRARPCTVSGLAESATAAPREWPASRIRARPILTCDPVDQLCHPPGVPGVLFSRTVGCTQSRLTGQVRGIHAERAGERTEHRGAARGVEVRSGQVHADVVARAEGDDVRHTERGVHHVRLMRDDPPRQGGATPVLHLLRTGLRTVGAGHEHSLRPSVEVLGQASPSPRRRGAGGARAEKAVLWGRDLTSRHRERHGTCRHQGGPRGPREASESGRATFPAWHMAALLPPVGPRRLARAAGGKPRARAGADPLRPDAGLALHVLPRRRLSHGGRPRRHAAHRA